MQAMGKTTVIILNYKRPENIQHSILPPLLLDNQVDLVIIAHGNPETVFDLDRPLNDGEQVLKGKVLHVGNYEENTTYRCFRRWRLIRKLYLEKIIKTDTIHSQDDDILFPSQSLHDIMQAHNDKKGLLICGTYGRNIVQKAYSFTQVAGPCELVIGRSMFGSVEMLCKAVDKAETLCIPTHILHEDDICMSLLTSMNDAKKHYALNSKITELPSPFALWKRANHAEYRNNTVAYLLNL
jgi:hypothetical protein